MGVELSIDPAGCPISAAGGTNKRLITNHTDLPLAFKIKSSNNSNYSVNVVYGVLPVGERAELIVTRIKGPPKSDHLQIQYASVAHDYKGDAKAAFATRRPGAVSD